MELTSRNVTGLEHRAAISYEVKCSDSVNGNGVSECIICNAFAMSSSKCITYNAFLVIQRGASVTLAELGPLLKQARTAAGLSQQQLAQPLGMSRATISAIESGRCEEIGFSKLAALLDSVGLEVSVAPRKRRPTVDDLRSERRRS